jgi:SMI1 / KNR4 family (SUKH-1)
MHTRVLFDEVVRTMCRWSSNGERQLYTGVRLICPTPQVAPEAWLHVLYPPATPEAIRSAEMKLGIPLPEDYKSFLLSANGFVMFSYRLAVWGIKKSMARTGDEAWQPYDLVNHNQETNRPEGSPSNLLYFGSTENGATRCFFELNDGTYRVGKTSHNSYHPDGYWPHFGSWLLDQMRSLEILFDSSGAMIVTCNTSSVV